jgi:hypothetical protein
MSAVTAPAPVERERTGALPVYRDDGPIARALGAALARTTTRPADRGAAHATRRAGPAVWSPELALVVVGVVPLLAALVVGRDDVSDPVVGAAIAWMVLWAGAASGAPTGGSLRWALLPVLRAAEYAGLLWLAALAGGDALPAAFALLAALAFRHYDLVYRMRLRGDAPPRWLGVLSLGWDGRLIGGYVLLVLGAVPAGFYVAAGVFGVAFVAEAVSMWAGVGGQPVGFEDAEDEEVE